MSSRQLLIMLLACTAAGQAQSEVIAQLNPIHLTFNLDASGQPSGFACMPDLHAPTCATIIAAAGRWKYAPGMSGGQPVAMRTWMTLNLQAVPKNGGFALTALGASVREAGAPSEDAAAAKSQYAPPRYPHDAMRRGEKGLVVLEAWIQPGTDRLSVRNAWLDGKKPRRRSALIDAATAAASVWQVEPHSPKVLSLCIPVQFTLARPAPSPDTSPCRPTYAEGYKSPELLTTPAQMVF